MQVGVAMMIFLNFVFQAVEAQVLPQPQTGSQRFFDAVEIIFLSIFVPLESQFPKGALLLLLEKANCAQIYL